MSTSNTEARLERLQEEIHEQAHAAAHHHRWILGVALSSALVAALAAVASMRAEHHINQALLSQVRSAEQWTYYQSRILNVGVLHSKIDVLTALGKPINPDDSAAVEKFTAQSDDIKKRAQELDASSTEFLEHHERLATSETMFQVSIAIAAICVLTQIRKFWWVSLAFALTGCYFLATGFVVR